MQTAPVADAELDALFAPFRDHASILLAVSGGPDSTALMHLAVRWREKQAQGPRLAVATVDHGLRPESAAEAQAVAAAAAALGLDHRICRWTGEKPARGIQAAARAARYRLLAGTAADCGATAIALGHTRDDQAETVLLRLARGSGLSGLAAMRIEAPRGALTLLRPFLDVPKARLVATLEAAAVPYARDPGNADPRFARPRLRTLAPALAAEGIDAAGLARLARRMARADAALEAATDAAAAALSPAPWSDKGPIRLDAAGLAALPEEIALRLLGRALGRVGTEGPVELAKLEALAAAIRAAEARPRTLAGAVICRSGTEWHIAPAPPRRKTPPLATNSEPAASRVLGKDPPRS